MSWWNPYADPRRELKTRLTPGECRERLKRRVAGWLAWLPSEERPVKGRVTAAGFAIHRFVFGRHGFETEARGRFEADAAGTRIPLRFGLKRLDLIYFVLFFLVILLVGGAFLLAPGGAPGPRTGEDAFPAWLPALMVACLLLIYVAVRWHLRGDAESLTRLIRETLDASEAQEQAPIE